MIAVLRPFACVVPLLTLAASLHAGSIGGLVFEDSNRNGIFDARERPLAGIEIELLGRDGVVSATTFTDSSGHYLFHALADGHYVVSARPFKKLRASFADRTADPPPVPNLPFGRPRYASMPNLIGALLEAAASGADFRHVALGDSIAFGFNLCGSLFGENGYIEPTTERLRRATAGTVITDKQAIPGHETADLLIPGLGPDFYLLFNDVFYAIDQDAQLVSISIGGNDFLAAEDGGDAAIAAALVTARRNLQEILSGLITGLPASEIELNTLYDNLQGKDPLHNVWTPILNQSLRELTFGQERRAWIAEVHPEYAHDESGRVMGQPGLICEADGDGIHPKNEGYDVHEEKLWQSFGGVTLSGSDRLDVDLGFLKRRRRLVGGAYEDVTGATLRPNEALRIDDVGALIPSTNQEFRIDGFLAHPRAATQSEDSIFARDVAQVVLKIRYRTLGAPVNDYYAFEASIDGSFREPGSTPSTWNTIIPIVGSSGNDGAERLVFPDVPDYRVVGAPVYLGAPIDGAPTLTWDDLETLTVRVVTHAVGAVDSYTIEWDGAWLEVYTAPPAGSRSDNSKERGHAVLRRLLATDQEQARQEIIASLGRGGALDGEIIEALGEIGDPVDASIVRPVLASPDGQMRAHALRSLVRMVGPASQIECGEAAFDIDPAVRCTAARAISALADRAQADLFERLIADPVASVRSAALTAVARSSFLPDAKLLGLLADPSARVRTEAAAILLRRGVRSALPVLISALADDATSRRAQAVLSDAVDSLQGELMSSLAGSHSVRQQSQLITVLGASTAPSEELLDSLRRSLSSSELELTVAALAALSRLGDRASLPQICALGDRHELAIPVARALGRFIDERAFATLQRIAASPDVSRSARWFVARALASCEDRAVVPYLHSLSAVADVRVRRLVESGLSMAR
jgi:HEAT repeat protein